ncbi:MAG: virulence factor SrfB [Candidatus Competibacter sp.]
MLAKLKKYAATINLIPNTAIQFLDFGFDLDQLRVSRAFLSETGADGRAVLTCLYADDAGGQFVTGDGRTVKPEQVYSLNAAKAAAIFAGAWLPVPFLRVRERHPDGHHLFDKGPTNWARARLVELPTPDAEGNTHRVTLAFDTQLLPTREGRPYLAPSPLDTQSGEEFALSDAEADTGWFLEQDWVREWLHQRFHAYELRRRAPRRVDEAELRASPDAQAAWLTVLTLLQRAVRPPCLRFTFVDSDPTARINRPVNVDLVLDVGNSRTCGMLMETSGDDPVDMNDSYRLELRDLSEPERVYDEPFPSRVEFVRGSFGDEKLSRRSGRTSAFLWPTATRVGYEAQTLSYYSHGTEGSTGLSGPKRYLWDTDLRHHPWRFNPGPGGFGGDSGPVTTGPFIGHLREDGEELAAGEPPAVSALFSRSSLMSFFVAEVLLQAFVQANSPARRYERVHSEAPRRLRRAILTLPTAMPLAERKLFARRVNIAVRLTWRALGLDESQAPEPFLQWDEATGTQIVFLYNEVKHNFQGDAALFFQVFGRAREGYGEAPCLRLASIDIGGGTTDLIITTYQLEGGTAVRPTQEFREGFNIAGDDVLCGIIERNVLPVLVDAIRQSGAANPEELLARLLGANQGRSGRARSDLAPTVRQPGGAALGAGAAAPLRKRRSQRRQRSGDLAAGRCLFLRRRTARTGGGIFGRRGASCRRPRVQTIRYRVFHDHAGAGYHRAPHPRPSAERPVRSRSPVRLRLSADFRPPLSLAGGAGRDSGQAAGAAGSDRQPSYLSGRRLVSVPLGQRPAHRSQDHGGGRRDGLRAVGRAVVQVQPAQPRAGHEIHRSLHRGAGTDRAAEAGKRAVRQSGTGGPQDPPAGGDLRFLRAGVSRVPATGRRTLAGHAAVSRHLRPSARREREGAAAQGDAGALHRRERRSGFQSYRRGGRRRQPAAGRRGPAQAANFEGRIRLLAGYRHLLDFGPLRRRAASLSVRSDDR